MVKKYANLESLIKGFAGKFTKKGPTYLNDKTTVTLFAKELARQIRKYAIVRKRVTEGDNKRA